MAYNNSYAGYCPQTIHFAKARTHWCLAYRAGNRSGERCSGVVF